MYNRSRGRGNFGTGATLILILILFLLSTPSAQAGETVKETGIPPHTTIASGVSMLEQLEAVFIQIADEVKPAVVNISPAQETHKSKSQSSTEESTPGVPPGSGSGVIIDPQGYIVTNHHVVGDAEVVEVRLSDHTRMVGKVIGRDPDTDVAVVKVESKKPLPVVKLGDSSRVKPGQWVIAVGNPFGLDRTVTVGVVSAVGREDVNVSRYEDFIQTDASINPGNSGGPLFNTHGEVVGINTAIINFAQGIGFAIPSNMVKQVMGQLITQGKVVRGWLGVGIQSLTAELAPEFGIEDPRGVLVNEVFEGNPASKAGIVPGDVIVRINDQNVDTPGTLSRVIAGLSPGDAVKIELVRGGEAKTVSVTLAQREAEATVVAAAPKPPESRLGIDVQNLTPDLAQRFKLKPQQGAIIMKVEPGGPAESEGLKEGDLIQEANKVPVKDLEDFQRALAKTEQNRGVLLRIVREDRSFYLLLRPSG